MDFGSNMGREGGREGRMEQIQDTPPPTPTGCLGNMSIGSQGKCNALEHQHTKYLSKQTPS